MPGSAAGTMNSSMAIFGCLAALAPMPRDRMINAEKIVTIVFMLPPLYGVWLLSFHEESEFGFRRRMRQQLVSGLLGKRLKVLDRARIGGDNAQHLADLHAGQRLFRAQYRQRAVETAHVQILVEIHVHFPG